MPAGEQSIYSILLEYSPRTHNAIPARRERFPNQAKSHDRIEGSWPTMVFCRMGDAKGGTSIVIHPRRGTRSVWNSNKTCDMGCAPIKQLPRPMVQQQPVQAGPSLSTRQIVLALPSLCEQANKVWGYLCSRWGMYADCKYPMKRHPLGSTGGLGFGPCGRRMFCRYQLHPA